MNSSHCNNVALINDSTKYYVSSSIFSNQSVYQSTVLQIVQTLSDSQKAKATGGLLQQQDEEFYATIKDMIQTQLTSTDMSSIGQSATNVNVYIQVCKSSDDSGNYIIASQKDLFKYYNSVYSQNSTVQSLAADISNYISGTQSEKKTGFLVVLIRMIALVIIGIVVMVIVIAGAYLITMKGG